MSGTGQDSPRSDRIDFVVGEEVRLREIVAQTNVGPLLDALIAAGASSATIEDAEGGVLAAGGDCASEKTASADTLRKPLYHEGECVGSLVCSFHEAHAHQGAHRIVEIAAACMQLVLGSTVRRMCATELHTTVVAQSYSELVETNRRLAESEQKYRQLAATLEKKVEERTAELKAAHSLMLQQEKMASIGQLAAGMAHEINNPLGFLISNLSTFETYQKKMSETMSAYRRGDESEGAGLYERLRIGFILEDAPELLRQSKEGAGRIKAIVANLKGFSHIDDAAEDYVNLNEELDRTIAILGASAQDRVTFIRHYGELPKYLCRPGPVCQVFLNILQNAIEATEEPVQVRITTEAQGSLITVRIEDDGPGIPDSVAARIFEPFFTTKDVGKGTGLGLSIAYDIVRSHGGEISVQSSEGGGAAFLLRLPARG